VVGEIKNKANSAQLELELGLSLAKEESEKMPLIVDTYFRDSTGKLVGPTQILSTVNIEYYTNVSNNFTISLRCLEVMLNCL
jgi:hypothetical protein